MRLVRIITAAFLACAALPAAAQTFQLDTTTRLPSSDTDWDHIALEPGGTRLFMARRKDGLTVFDTASRRVAGTVEDSVGANSTVLAPEFDRGYAAMTDGTVLSFDLGSLHAIDRIKVDDAGLGGSLYEPTTKRVHVIASTPARRTAWITLDAATGKVLGRTAFDSTDMADPAADGRGAIYAPLRDQNALLKLRASDLSVEQRWTLGACVQPTAVAYEHRSNRVLIGCRGDAPVLVALDPADGRVTATIPIGRGVGGIAFDAASCLIVTSNGADATFSIIRQDGPDAYHLVETMSTRPMARVVAFDPQTGRLHTVAAAFSLPAPGPDGTPPPPRFHPDSFTVLTYTRAPRP